MSTTRKADLEASRKRLGLVTEEVWLQHTPSGDFAVVYLEGDDIPGSLSGMRTSEEPFDKWFRDNMLVGSHGFDMSQDMNLDNEHVLSVRIQ